MSEEKTNMRIQKLASVFYGLLEYRKLDREFYCIKNGLKKSTEESTRRLCKAAHVDGGLADDYVYDQVHSALSFFSGCSPENDHDFYEECEADPYTHIRIQWMASSANRQARVDEIIGDVCAETGGDFDIGYLIGRAMTKENEEIYSAVLAHLTKIAEGEIK